MKVLKEKSSKENLEKLERLNNPAVVDFIERYIELCNPKTVFVCNDSEDDINYIRKKAIELKEESEFKVAGHTIHFDGYFDLARDKSNTKYLLSEDTHLGPNISGIDRTEGLEEMYGFLKGSMQGKEAYVCFFSLGPARSKFSIPAIQITDSSYVAHSEGLLYRNGYEVFKDLGEGSGFFRFVHSAGLLENNVSKEIKKRRIYIDLKENTVYSVNTQYGGNTIGLKKLAMRLAIKKASSEGWLTEHMFIMGIRGKNKRVTYFTGAFPSACGKTSTAMLKDEMIVGDDIAYLKEVGGYVRAVNVERGMFGIIKDVNSEADPLIWEALTSAGEIIFSNILVTEDKTPYWLGKDGEEPGKGINYSGAWYKGKKDKEGGRITSSHKNARYTVKLERLANCDPQLNSPEGVIVKGIIYGGRDSDTSVPVEEAFDWQHGILTKAAALESETTAATLGQEGVRKFNPMSNLDFLSIPIGKYVKNNLKFAETLKEIPAIFSVNYFLKGKDGNYLNGIHDKHVWLKWMELKVHNEVEVIRTPSGFIPLYEDLKTLFKEVLNKEYSKEEYDEQFQLRIPESLKKIERIVSIYKEQVHDAPDILFEEVKKQKDRLLKIKQEYGDYVKPEKLQEAALKKDAEEI